MDNKMMEFPCTKKCLVYACCNKICWAYTDYVEEAFREQKYKCFKIIPPPPKQIQELSELMNRVEHHTHKAKYYPASDLLIVYAPDNETLVAVIGEIRKRKDIKRHHNFPKELM